LVFHVPIKLFWSPWCWYYGTPWEIKDKESNGSAKMKKEERYIAVASWPIPKKRNMAMLPAMGSSSQNWLGRGWNFNDMFQSAPCVSFHEKGCHGREAFRFA